MKKNLLRLISLTLMLSLCLCLFAGCGDSDKSDGGTTTQNGEPTTAISAKYTKAMFNVKDFGSFVVEVYPQYAPETAENFLRLVDSGYYDGLTFHRIVDDFMAQGGDGATAGKSTPSIKGEFALNGFTQNTLTHERGTISMARTNEYDSASGQFFICYSAKYASSLDGGYAAFGKVIDGMDVIDSFCEVERSQNMMGEMATPVKDIVIESAMLIAE